MVFKEITTSDQNMQFIQNNVSTAVKNIENGPLTGGQLLSSLSLKTGQDNIVPHQLGNSPTIILPMAPDVDTRIWSPPSPSLSGSNVSSTQINLRCSANCVVSVMVK